MPGPRGFHLPSDEASRNPFVRIYVEDRFFRSFRIPSGITVFGRDPSVDVLIPGRFVSRRHFQIEFAGDRHLFLQDLGSSNGILVNGERVTRTTLGHGDEIRFGQVRLLVSHRAFAQAKIIPFPAARTDPEIEVDVPRSPDPQPSEAVEASEPLPAPTPSRWPQRVRFLLVLCTAALLAWQFNRLQGDILGNIDRLKSAAMSFVWGQPQEVVRIDEEMVEDPKDTLRNPPEAPTPSKPESHASSPIRPESRRAPTPVRAKEDVVESLRKSLGDLDGQVLKIPSVSDRGDWETLTAFRGARDFDDSSVPGFDVEVELPQPVTQTKGDAREAPVRLDRRATQELLRARVAPTARCYATFVKDGTPGKVSVGFFLDTAGRATNARIRSSDFKNAQLHRCILERIRRIRVDPPPAEGFEVRYGFRFGPQKIDF